MSHICTLRRRLERPILTDDDWIRAAPSAGLYWALTGVLSDEIREYARPWPFETGLAQLEAFFTTSNGDANAACLIVLQKWALLAHALGYESSRLDRLLARAAELPLSRWGLGLIRAWRTRTGLRRALQIEAVRRPKKARGWKGQRVDLEIEDEFSHFWRSE